MTDWMIWFVAACVLVVLEMASGTFYLLMLAIGVAAGGIAAIADASGVWQCVIAALVAAVATTALHRSRYGKSESLAAARNPDVNLDIGQSVTVDAWQEAANMTPRARVPYRGALWDVELAAGSKPLAGVFVIEEVRGSCLIVRNRDAGNSGSV
jgi:membrane protein implicated in regulation of membrane protease activity